VRRIVMAVLTVVIGTMFGLLVSTTAQADSGSPPAQAAVNAQSGSYVEAAANRISGTLKAGITPVEGVTITVKGPDGTEVGKATTDAAGKWAVEVTDVGKYTVELDVTTLPEGVALAENAQNPRTVEFQPGETFKAALFNLTGGEAAPTVSAKSPFLQALISGIRFGLILAVASIGLSMVFGTTGFSNFAHGELLTLGAFSAYVLNVTLGIQLILATILSLIICALIGGYAQDRLLWGPLRKRGTGIIAMMIISIGLALAVRYIFLVVFEGNTLNFRDYQGGKSWDLGPVTLAPKDLVIVIIALIFLVATVLVLNKTRMGKATRAVSDNPALASASGIDVDQVIRLVWIVGAVLAGLAGILYSAREGVKWDMGGSGLLLLMFAGVVLGGLGTTYGAIFGSLIVGLLIELSALVIPVSMKNVGALAVMIIILLVRPDGLFGRRERIG